MNEHTSFDSYSYTLSSAVH